LTARQIVDCINQSITFGKGTEHPDDGLRFIAEMEGSEAAVQAVLDVLADPEKAAP
jgi:hypothetical protein